MKAKSLTQFAQGRMARLVSVDTEDASRNRLASLGLIPGEVIEVLSASRNGPFVIGIKASRLALQHDLAACVKAQDL